MIPNFGFTFRTKVGFLAEYVFFTTFAKWLTDTVTTPTGVGCEEVQEARKCCVFYNKIHIPLDFTMKMVYNKA